MIQHTHFTGNSQAKPQVVLISAPEMPNMKTSHELKQQADPFATV